MNKQGWRVFYLFFVGLLGCSKPAVRSETWLNSFAPFQMRYRAEPYRPADPDETPGTSSYISEKAPSKDFDCKSFDTLLVEQKMDLQAVFRCLHEVEDGVTISYKLDRNPKPMLRLIENKKSPECLKQVLSVIPVGREVIFQSREKGILSCYSTRLQIENGKKVGLDLPVGDFELKVRFPIQPEIESVEKTRIVIQTWGLMPFFEESSSRFRAKIIPDSVCAACFGGADGLKKTTDPDFFYWPDKK